MTTPATIQRWFEEGVAEGKSHMIVATDTFSYEDYPVYVDADEVAKKVDSLSNQMMTKVMEVYRLTDDMNEQLNEGRCWRL